jgi:hypothetical protein
VASKPAARELTQNDVFALNNDITVYLTGKTQSELEALLGKALSRDDPDGYSQEFSLQSATLPLANYPGPYTRASVQFDAPPALGGKVKYVTLR